MNMSHLIAKIADKENLTKRENFLYRLFKRIINEPAQIYTYTYRERIRISHPYISFVFLDTDSKPIAKNIQLSQSYSYIPFNHINLSPREKPTFRSFELDAQPSAIDRTVPTAEQPVSLTAALDPNAQREKPVIQSFELDAPASAIDRTVPTAEQPVSLTAALDPNAQREKPVFWSFMLDAPASAIDKLIPSVEQLVSLDARRNFNPQNKEVLSNSYILETQFGQCIHKITTEEGKCDSYHISLLMSEPCCYDHHILRHETGCRISRFRRYRTIDHIAYLKTKPAT
jgi:hypothetical protein